MDFDSSSKFISSLAKFLQSLCNGYVEFDNGVEVIGHIYLSVDTGKKIDYILNEKVCKTDENSVTFISNSFHAQPAEKPKPVEKPKQNVPAEQDTDSEIILMDDSEKSFDQFSDNVQKISTPAPKPQRSLGASKRSFSQSFSSNRSSSKLPKFDSSLSSNPNGAHNSVNDSAFNPSVSSNIAAASESEPSRLPPVFPDHVNDSSSQDRDVKPVLDKDLNVINVKQEYDHSADVQGEGNLYDEPGDGSYYSQDQSYESGNEQYYGGGHQNSSQRSDYDSLNSSKMFMGETGPSGGTGESQGSTCRICKAADKSRALWRPGEPCPVVGCLSVINHTRYSRHWREQHVRIVSKYLCPYCESKFKRREKLIRHSLNRHGVTVDRADQVEVKEVNCQFIDPSPLSLDEIMGT